jgi:hypothetical protein
MGIVAEVCQSFVLDNGAYSVWKSGHTLDVDGYIQWCYQWYRHPGFDWAIVPDVIEGSEADNDALLCEWPTDIRGAAVWHMNESIDRLLRLANDWDVVAIGSSGAWSRVGDEGWWIRIGQAMDALCDEYGRPPCRLHGLKMLDPKVFTKLPLSSADSTTAARRSNMNQDRFGMYVPATAAQRAAVVADRIEAHNSAPCWIRTHQQNLFAA